MPQHKKQKKPVITDPDPDNFTEGEPVSFDETVRRALAFCDTLPGGDFAPCRAQLAELQTRLSGGRLHFAVLGQFNRGKSTFINALLGMQALPTSVLPMTSVPTVIEYGAERVCKIRFTDGTDDLIVNDSPAAGAAISRPPSPAIEETLRKYVAEENNPKNKYRVRDATITCASEILVNGTALIDTPGFGSTHLHNTRTTLDLLIECDAALFLLSADPPMTQTEMEFLRDVKERVPKIFFILNKVDLLTPQGLGEVDRFIKKILYNELGFPGDTALYHTSAIKGWEESGLEAVRREVLDFMLREKYFTLSGALRGKYGEAAASIESLLEKKLEDMLAPMNALRGEVSAITGAIQSLSLELESTLKKCADERDALDAKIGALAGGSADPHARSMEAALGALLSGSHFPPEAASIASALLPKHASGLGARLLGDMAGQANRSIRSLALGHTLALAALQKRYAALTGVEARQADAEALIGRLEIDASDSHDLFDSAPWDVPQPQISDIFRKRSVRLEMIREFYEPLCAGAISKNTEKAVKHARAQAGAAWKQMQESISDSYRRMIDGIKQQYRSKQDELDRMEAESKQDVSFLRDKLRELKTLVQGHVLPI